MAQCKLTAPPSCHNRNMKVPRGGSGKWDWLCQWLDQKYRRPWVKYGLAPALVAVPPWVVNKLLDSSPLKTWLATNAPAAAVLVGKYELAFYLLACVYSWAVLAMARAVAKRVAATQLDTAGLLTLLSSLDGVVGSKLERFRRHHRDVGSLTPQTAFQEITQPVQQIGELVRAIASYFNARRPSSKATTLIKVVLAEIEGGKIREIPYFFPMDEPIRSPIKVLNSPNSGILVAARTKRIHVVESIAKELKRGKSASYVATGNPDDNKGSLICYPVLGGEGKTVLVISVHCDEDGYFQRSMAPLYDHTLARFALRLNPEFTLFQMREKLCGNRQQGSAPAGP